MKKAQEKLLSAFKEALNAAYTAVEQLHNDGDNHLEEIRGELEDVYAEMSEGVQDGEKGEKNQSARDALEEINDLIEQAKDGLNEALTKIDLVGEG